MSKHLPGPYLSFQLQEVGDFLATLPALGFLKISSQASVGAVVAPPVAELALRHSWIDEVFTLDPKRDIRHLRKVARAIARKGYRTALMFDGRPKSLLAAALAGIKNRLGGRGLYAFSPLSPLYSHEIDLRGETWALESQAFRSQKMAAALLGLAPGEPLRPPPPAPDPVSSDRALKLLSEAPAEGPRIGLALEGRNPERIWPLAHFAALCRRLRRELKAALFAVGEEEMRPLAGNMARAAGVPVANFCGRASLSDIIALAEASDLFITQDIGAAHLAALTNTPVISIYAWSNPVLRPPQTPHARLLVYEWALKRFGLKPTDGPWLRPWLTAPIITPDLVFQETVVMLRAMG